MLVTDVKRGEVYDSETGEVLGRSVELSLNKPSNVTLRTDDENLSRTFEMVWLRMSERSKVRN